MDFILVVIFFFLIGYAFCSVGYAIGKLAQFLIPSDKSEKQEDTTTFINHNYIKETHNHLHVTEKFVKELDSNHKK